jgi:Zn-dependent protease with chaperone function
VEGSPTEARYGEPDPCPNCGATLPVATEFVRWCPERDWNVVPGLDASGDQSERRAARSADRLYAELRRHPGLRTRWGAPALLAVAIAVAVDLLTLLVAAGAVVLAIEFWPSIVALVVAAAMLAFAYLLRPRLGRIPKDAVALPRSEAPAVHDLVDRMRRSLGARPVRVILVDDRYNASSTAVGLRRRRILVIGMPLWVALGPQERVAVIAHELGHDVNGDPRRGWLMTGALSALREWSMALSPDRVHGHDAEGFVQIGDWLGRIISWPLAWAARTVWRVELLLALQSGQRGEYLADELASQLASTDATVSGLEKLLWARSCLWGLRAAVIRGVSGDALWRAEREYLSDLPDEERERLRRASERVRPKLDDSHPPTSWRIELLRQRDPHESTLTLTADESAGLDAQLRRSSLIVARELVERLPGVHFWVGPRYAVSGQARRPR